MLDILTTTWHPASMSGGRLVCVLEGKLGAAKLERAGEPFESLAHAVALEEPLFFRGRQIEQLTECVCEHHRIHVVEKLGGEFRTPRCGGEAYESRKEFDHARA